MSELTYVILSAVSPSDDGQRALFAIFGGELPEFSTARANRHDLYLSVRPLGHGFYAAAFDGLDLRALLHELLQIGFEIPETTGLFVQDPESNRWSVYELEPDGSRWNNVIAPAQWDGTSWRILNES